MWATGHLMLLLRLLISAFVCEGNIIFFVVPLAL